MKLSKSIHELSFVCFHSQTCAGDILIIKPALYQIMTVCAEYDSARAVRYSYRAVCRIHGEGVSDCPDCCRAIGIILTFMFYRLAVSVYKVWEIELLPLLVTYADSAFRQWYNMYITISKRDLFLCEEA